VPGLEGGQDLGEGLGRDGGGRRIGGRVDGSDPSLDPVLAEQPVEHQEAHGGPARLAERRKPRVVHDEVEHLAVVVDGDGDARVGQGKLDLVEDEVGAQGPRVGGPGRGVLPGGVRLRPRQPPPLGQASKLGVARRRDAQDVPCLPTLAELPLEVGMDGVDVLGELVGQRPEPTAGDGRLDPGSRPDPPRPEAPDRILRRLRPPPQHPLILSDRRLGWPPAGVGSEDRTTEPDVGTMQPVR
jgi:hypothetical protein